MKFLALVSSSKLRFFYDSGYFFIVTLVRTSKIVSYIATCHVVFSNRFLDLHFHTCLHIFPNAHHSRLSSPLLLLVVLLHPPRVTVSLSHGHVFRCPDAPDHRGASSHTSVCASLRHVLTARSDTLPTRNTAQRHPERDFDVIELASFLVLPRCGRRRTRERAERPSRGKDV